MGIKVKEDIKSRKIFDYLVLFSLFFVTGFYWPNHQIVQMKYMCWEMFVTFLMAMYFIFGQIRKVNDWIPGLFLTYCIINMFTHLIGGNTKFAMMTVFFTILGYYIIANGLSLEGVQRIKKGIVIYAILNCGSYFLERFGIDSPFTIQGDAHLPTGFMVYPAHFALLCAIALFFTWEWKKYLCIPLACGLIAVNEYSVYLGFILCIVYTFRKKWYTWVFLSICILALCFPLREMLWHQIHTKVSIRTQFFIPIWKLSWTRPIDGYGIGSYSGLANQIFKEFPPNTWLELHNELLQGFFEGGLILIGIIFIWFMELRKKIVGAYYEKPFIFSFIVLFTTSCAHSVLHFPDCCWIVVILLACFGIEHYEANLKWHLEKQ